MKKERLVIKNFGPIKSVDLELGKMTILIGEQATGKSTIAKVLAVCRHFSYIVNFIDNNIAKYNSFSKGLNDWDINDFVKSDTYIFYENAHYSFEAKSKQINEHVANDEKEKPIYSTVNFIETQLISISSEFKGLINELNKIRPSEENYYGSDWIPNENFFRLNVKRVMDNPFFFPTERGLQSIFSLGKNSIQNISDSLFNQFASIDRISRNFSNEIEIKPLNIFYKYQNNQGFTRKKVEKDFYPLRNGASGFQSTIPIVLATKFYIEMENRKRTFIIEEPELNLFPKAQKKLMEFFVENINTNGHSFLLPTHSPYFLSAINDLLMAYKKGQKNQTEVEEIINKESWLNPNDLSVYELKNGEAFDIFDKKIGLIADNIIDDVSDEMNDEFDELLDIK